MALQASHWLVVIDNGSYETLTYFLNRTIAELWQRKHGGLLYERELEPPYWRAAKPRQTNSHQPHDRAGFIAGPGELYTDEFGRLRLGWRTS
jgi:hypothetical protein